MNLLCGVIGVIVALGGNLQLAFILMLAAAVADFFDGFAARLLGAYSEIGKELDSLADDVSFGVLPSVMLYCVFGTEVPCLRFFPLLIAAFSALRLPSSTLTSVSTAASSVCRLRLVLSSAAPLQAS
ncbi:MAG: CDP-alcohol phosphatidyltransferase family protein [Bacteroidales bacterium]|nr:CDP-alcohol phosphatidyltransferase family protein [Candidatus Cryptobacteroides faecihippi]